MHIQVWASPRAADFLRGRPHGSPTDNVKRDLDEGNVLWLDPQLPQIAGSPVRDDVAHTKHSPWARLWVRQLLWEGQMCVRVYVCLCVFN